MPVGRSGKEWTDIRQNYQVKKGDRHIFVHAMNRLSIPLPWNITDTKTVHMFTEETRKLSGKKKKLSWTVKYKRQLLSCKHEPEAERAV